jgi:SAM-dependent methyltransferase
MANGVHRAAAVGFTSAVDVYEASRPTIPAEAVDWLLDELAVSAGETVLELGAGTGKFTRLLLERGVAVLAVEPVAAMRERLSELGDGVTTLDAVAEALPLPAGAARAAVAVQSFHWFDAPRTLEELHRVLEPGGRIGLAWNDRDADAAPWQRDLDALIEPHRGDAPTHRTGAWRDAVAASPVYELRESREWRWVQRMTAGLLVDRVASISFVAAMPDDERAALLADVQRLAIAVSGSDDPQAPLDQPYVAGLHVIAPTRA